MKIAYLALAFTFTAATVVSASTELCSPLNHCRIKKTAWKKDGWKTLAEKDLKFEKFCADSRPQANLEKELGIELWVFAGDKETPDSFTGKPHVTVSLHTHKLTHVIASATVPLDSQAVSFTHRLKADGKELVQIECAKK